MAVFKCKICGSSLEVTEGMTVCECSYCGNTQTLSKQRDEISVNKFNRANNLRLKAEFDKAYNQYEKLILDYPDDSESYWGMVLCKFGVEYIKDTDADQMIPVLHRTQVDSVKTDPDYRSALEHADANQRVVYEREAEQIDFLQKEVMAVAKRESPYDVFICCMETDENGARTPDSAIANEIYYQLTQDGLKVFYEAITLNGKSVREYEPYIYAALHTARYMLVLGTCPEYFEMPRVRNEWNRYLKIIQLTRTGELYPCYRDMDPSDLPEELIMLPAQNMGEVGFVAETVRRLKKVLKNRSVSESDSSSKEAAQETAGQRGNIEDLLKKGDNALINGNWDEAMQLYDQVLDEDAEEYRAYIGQLCAEMEVKGEEVLDTIGSPIMSSNYYKRACRFGGKEVEDRLYGYVTKRESDHKQNLYDALMRDMQMAEKSTDYANLVPRFRELGDYKDSSKKADECWKKSQELGKTEILNKYNDAVKRMQEAASSREYESLVSVFQRLGDYGDSRQRMEKCKELMLSCQKKEAYNNAVERMKTASSSEDYKALAIIFKGLDDYLDSPRKVEECITLYGAAGADEYWEHIRNCKPGDVVEFGDYEWIVLSQNCNIKFILCKDVIGTKEYHPKWKNTNWGRCGLRKWLNDEFYSSFPPSERKMICRIRNQNNKNTKCHTRGSRPTDDYIFLLSIEEAQSLRPDILEIGTKWWLRSPGLILTDAAGVGADGQIQFEGYVVNHKQGVRPAMYIKTD